MDEIHRLTYESPIGQLYLAEQNGFLIGLWMEGQKYFGQSGGKSIWPTSQLENQLEKGVAAIAAQISRTNVLNSKQNDGKEMLSETLALAADWLDCYFAGKRPDKIQVPLAPMGSPFRQRVWKALQEIPYGETATYGEIAKRLEKKAENGKTSARAVGGAVGHNPIGILIPCHRIIGADGSLTGYAGGVEKKAWLLAHEKNLRWN